jgi:hypothetical protein
MSESRIYGLAALFDNADQLVEAARGVRELGYTKIEAYTPYAVEELDEIIPGFNPLPALVFLGGATGAATAWAMQYYIAAIDYPINVGGRPLYSWPAFIPILFELTVLFASITAFVGSLALSGLPRPNFPMFNSPRFAAASRDGFFLCIEQRDVLFDREQTAELLESFHPMEVIEVENS